MKLLLKSLVLLLISGCVYAVQPIEITKGHLASDKITYNKAKNEPYYDVRCLQSAVSAEACLESSDIYPLEGCDVKESGPLWVICMTTAPVENPGELISSCYHNVRVYCYEDS